MSGFDGFEVLLPALIGAAGGGDSAQGGTKALGFHQGIVESWNESTGANSIRVNGNLFTDLRVLSTSDSIMLTAGDTVGLLRFQTTYFVLGRIAAVGAGAGLRVRAAGVNTQELTTSTTYTNLATVGPTLTDVYVGSRRTCLVIASAEIYVAQSAGFMSFQVTGASTIGPGGSATPAVGASSNANQIGSTCTAFSVLTSADGLNAGLNTFQAKYAAAAFGGPASAAFQNRRLMVFPL